MKLCLHAASCGRRAGTGQVGQQCCPMAEERMEMERFFTAPTSPPDRRAAAQASTHTPGCPWAQGALGGPHPQLQGSHPVAPIGTYWAGHCTKGAPKWFRRAGLLAGTVGLGAALGVSLVRWQQGEKDANRDYYWISKKKKTPNLPTWKFIKIFHLT